MKKTLLLIFITFMIHCDKLFSQNTPYEESITHITSTLNVNNNYAKWIINTIDNFTTRLQEDIEYIANSTESYSKKTETISYVINEFFESNLSEIDISSNITNSIQTRTANEYLYRLAKIKDIYGYKKVELIFKPDFLGMGTFKKVDDSMYEISITMIQVFKAWLGDNISYSDVTRKKLRLNFYFNSQSNSIIIKINRILVSETYDLEQFNKKYQ